MKLRFIHAADLHLDSPFKGLQHLPVSIRQRITQSTFTAYEKMIAFAIQEKVDFLLIAGDVYDSAERSLKAQLQFKKGLERLSRASIACFIVHGNHDPLDGQHIALEWPEQVIFFQGDQVGKVPFYKHGKEVACIYGISYPTAKMTANVSKDFKRGSEVFSIGLLHTNCDGESAHANYAPCSKKDLLQANFDYWALGHIHQRNILHEQPAIVYPGNLQGRHINEQGEKGCYLVEVDQFDHVRLSFQAMQDVLWLHQEVDLTDLQEFQEVMDAVEESLAQVRYEYRDRPVIVRLTAVGQTALWEELSQIDVIEDLVATWRKQEAEKETFVWIESFRFQGSMVYQREELRAGEGIYADLIHIVDELLLSKDKRKMLYETPLTDLLNHSRAKKFLSSFSEEEEKQMIREAEAFVLAHLIGGEKR